MNVLRWMGVLQGQRHSRSLISQNLLRARVRPLAQGRSRQKLAFLCYRRWANGAGACGGCGARDHTLGRVTLPGWKSRNSSEPGETEQCCLVGSSRGRTETARGTEAASSFHSSLFKEFLPGSEVTEAQWLFGESRCEKRSR